MKRALGLLAVLTALTAGAAPFTITLTNTSTNAAYGWSTGLLTLQPLIAIGLTPQPGTPQYFTYAFANSTCAAPADAFCSGACNDDGNAVVLAQRWGLTLGTNAWLVPAIAANGGTTTVTIDAPPGSRLSYIAWVANTGVFDDFVAMHPSGNNSTLSIPLFGAGGLPLEGLDFVVSGYDSNSTSPTDGSGTTCAPACPTPTTGCYVAAGNASTNATGTFPPPATPNIANFVSTSGNAQNRLKWTNVSPHSGVVIARRAIAVTWAPTTGVTYTAGQQVNGGGNPTTIAYADDAANAASAFSDTGINATRYFYKVFAHANGKTYASGSVPVSTGLFSEPTVGTGSTPIWCYSVGFPSMQQPVTKLGTAVFTANNGGSLTANLTTPGTPATDGSERWRPVQLQAAVQSRPLSLPTQIGDLLITGDQSGHGYAVNPTTGAVVWTANGGAALGNAIQGQPVAQLYAYEGSFGAAGAAFQAANPGRDLVFFATRNASTTNNKVYAVSSTNGAVVWTYAPGNLDIISGGMAVDYVNNRLYVAAHNGLRILNSLTGAQVGSLLGGVALDFGVNLDFAGGTAVAAYTVSATGTAYGISLATMTQTWSFALPGPTSTWIFPTGNGFIASIKAGGVRRYSVSGATVTLVWTAAPAVPSPNGATIAYTLNKIYVGSSDGKLRQLNYDTGVVEKTLSLVTVAPTDLGFPTIDSTVNRLHVGTMDGRICAVPIPLP